MACFLTKRQIKTFEYRIHWNINVRKKILYEKINDSLGWNKHSGSTNQKPNSTVPVMLCTVATFVKKNSCLVATTPDKISGTKRSNSVKLDRKKSLVCVFACYLTAIGKV